VSRVRLPNYKPSHMRSERRVITTRKSLERDEAQREEERKQRALERGLRELEEAEKRERRYERRWRRRMWWEDHREELTAGLVIGIPGLAIAMWLIVTLGS